MLIFKGISQISLLQRFPSPLDSERISRCTSMFKRENTNLKNWEILRAVQTKMNRKIITNPFFKQKNIYS